MEQQINTIIVLRNDQTTNWESSGYKPLKGEVGIGYLANGNVIAKLGVDGKTAWKDLPQIEGVLENEITLTHDFGRYKTDAAKGYVKTTDAKDKTISQWLIHALSETKEPVITQPTFRLTASAEGAGGEIGSKLTKLKWDGNTTYGSYEYGPSTGLGAANRTWSISNNIDNQTSTSEDGEFVLSTNDQIQLTQEESKTYAIITGTYNLDASTAADPVNNVGTTTTGKITSKTDTIEALVNATAYRKPFYGVLAAGSAINVDALTSDIIRSLPKSGTSNKGLPSVLDVPVGSQMVIFAAKAGVYKTLVAKDSKAMNAEVGFTKVANAVRVKGANNFVTSDTGDESNGALYDIWYVDWNPDKVAGYTGIESAKQLNLTWGS